MVKLPRRHTARSTVAVAAIVVGGSLGKVGGGQDDADGAAEALKSLREQYGAASGEFRKATTDEGRKAAVERLHGFPARFVELAEKQPGEASAIDILVEAVRAMNAVDSLTQTTWEMNTAAFPVVARDDAARRATELLLRHHLRSDKLGLLCQRMSYGIREELASFLRAVLALNSHRDVQALACLSLARFLDSRAQRLALVEDRPELLERYESLFGKERFDGLRKEGRAAITRDVEALLERAIAEYAGVKVPYGGTAGEEAGAALYELRHLAAGKPAPDIEGEDQDGKRFKLSDYRGKVVLLDFWSEY